MIFTYIRALIFFAGVQVLHRQHIRDEHPNAVPAALHFGVLGARRQLQLSIHHCVPPVLCPTTAAAGVCSRHHHQQPGNDHYHNQQLSNAH